MKFEIYCNYICKNCNNENRYVFNNKLREMKFIDKNVDEKKFLDIQVTCKVCNISEVIQEIELD